MADQSSTGGSGKRPYATLDLKATEIKVSRLNETTATDVQSPAAKDVPHPAPASSYRVAGTAEVGGTTANASSRDAQAARASASANTTASAASAASAKSRDANGAAQSNAASAAKGGGFFSHLAASLIGGFIALTGAGVAERHFGIDVPFVSALPATTSPAMPDIANRLHALETRVAASNGDISGGSIDATGIDPQRIAGLEEAVKAIPALKDAQSKLAADTKAALAAGQSDIGAPEQLTRLAALEDKFKSLEQVGANDPNAGRVAQVAALTGKVADLESALATQITELRKSLTADVDSRLANAMASSEAAKAGTQRIDRDIATLKSEDARFAEASAKLQATVDVASEAAKRATADVNALKTDLDGMRAEFGTAVTPLTDRMSAVDASLAELKAAEVERKANATRVVQALELQNLKRAVDSGAPYADALQSLQARGTGTLDLTALESHKATGVATLADLRGAFSPAANAALDAVQAPAEGSVFDRLVAGAKSIVRIRKTNHAPDDASAEAVVGRMEVALNDGKLADVVAGAGALPDAAKTALRPFLDKVEARLAVDTAMTALERDLKAAFDGQPASAPTPPASVTQ